MRTQSKTKDQLQRREMLASTALKFAGLYALVAILLTSITYVAWRLLRAEEISLISRSETRYLSIHAGEINGKLDGILADLHYLARSREVIEYLDDPSPEHTHSAGEEFLDIAKAKFNYSQIRFLDTDGMELIRVATVDGQAVTTSPDQLQDKSSRYYYQDAIKLASGEIYLSRMDLNIEHGEIEQPFKPVFRIAMPLADSQGSKRGLLVLNYLAEGILGPLREARELSTCLLINDASYYLLSAEPAKDWAFMFPDDPQSKQTRFSSDYPAAWAAMQAKLDGNFVSNHGLFTFGTIDPHLIEAAGSQLQSVGALDPQLQDSEWRLISFIPGEQLDSLFAGTLRTIKVGYAILMLASLLICLLVAHQMTRRRFAEEALKQSESRMRGILEAATDAIITVDTQGVILSVNKAAEQMFGYSSEELVGKPADMLIGSEFKDHRHQLAIARYLASDSSRILGNTNEFAGKRKDGSEFPMEHTISKVMLGDTVIFTGILRDITERKMIEDEHRASEERFRRLSQLAREGILLHEDGIIIDCNNAAIDMFGYSQAELIGLSILELVPEQRRIQLAARISEQDEGNYEELSLRKDKSSFPVAVSSHHSPFRGRQVRVSVVQDLTIQKEHEQLALQQKELEAIQITAATHAHEINNPLTGIGGVLQVLSQENLDADVRAMVNDAMASVNRIRDVILKMEQISTPHHRPYVGGKEILDLRDNAPNSDVIRGK